MVIGNGFFCDTLDDAIQEMGLIAHSDVALVPLPVNGNIIYYISENVTRSEFRKSEIGTLSELRRT